MKDEMIEKINSLDLKNLKTKELKALSEEIRQYIIARCSENGGHLASNLGVVELTIALHRVFNFPQDKLLFDVGHQCYTHKILSNRSLYNLRTKDGVTGFQNKEESEYDYFDAGHSSTSISSALGIAVSRDNAHEDYEIISVIGDASLSSGLALEALNNQLPDHKIIIIINDNDMSISNSVGALHVKLQEIRLSKKYLNARDRYRKALDKNAFTKFIYRSTKAIKDFFKKIFFSTNIFEEFGFSYIGRVDGHDFHDLEKALNKAKKSNRSTIIHVSTTKGKGYNKLNENNMAKFHNTNPFNIETGEQISSLKEGETTFSKVYASLLDKELEENKDSILICPGTTYGCKLDEVFSKYPERCFDVGISEEHALTFASGYSLSNKKSYVSIYSSFLQRGYDELSHDIARNNGPVTILVDHAGLVGGDGKTHQGIYDEAMMLSIPNLIIATASNKNEAIDLFNLSKEVNTPFIIRYPLDIIKDNEYKPTKIKLNKWVKVTNKKQDKLVISLGPIVNELKSLKVDLINALFINPLDEEMLNECLDYQKIYIVNPYATKEGFIKQIESYLLEHNYKGQVFTKAIRNDFIKASSIEDQIKNEGLDIESIKAFINNN